MTLIHGDFRPDLHARPYVFVPEPLTMQEAADILAAAAATREDEGLAALLRAAFVEGV